MEQQPALSTILCLVFLIHTWGAGEPQFNPQGVGQDGGQRRGTNILVFSHSNDAAAEIADGCRRVWIQNLGSSTQTRDGLRVSQEPQSLNATAGETVTLTCTFQNRDGSRARALWLRGSGEDGMVDYTHPFYRGRLHVSSLDEITQGNATLTLSQLEEQDSGFYRCCIKIYNKETGTGGGTELRVMQGKLNVTGDILTPGNNRKELQPEPEPELTIYRAVIALTAVSIIVLAGMLVMRRRKGDAETPRHLPAKRDGRSGNDASEGLHYAEIRFKPPAHTEYASVCT